MTPQYERRVEVRRVTSRFPTGEIKTTVSEGLQWVDEYADPPQGYVYCAISSDAPEAREMNLRTKKNTRT